MLGKRTATRHAMKIMPRDIKSQRIGVAMTLNSAVSQELNVLGKSLMATGAVSEVTALRQASGENPTLEGSIVTVEKQKAAKVGGPNRGGRLAVAGIDTVAIANRKESDRGFGG